MQAPLGLSPFSASRERNRHPRGDGSLFRARRLAAVSLATLLATADAGRAPAETSGAADESAPVTEANLLASDALWPYHVSLVRPWPPPGDAQPLPLGIPGVLIRVEGSGLARIDFGRDGIHTVPVRETDLLERANRVRTGALEKDAPNFALAIGKRLLDSNSASLRPVSLVEASAMRGFLCVFADPDAEGFPELVAALRAVRDRHGVRTILFPQGPHFDAKVHERLVALEWTVHFLPGHLSQGYTRSLLPDATPRPAVLLVTPQGRVLFQSAWRADVSPELRSALDEAFGGETPERTTGTAR